MCVNTELIVYTYLEIKAEGVVMNLTFISMQ